MYDLQHEETNNMMHHQIIDGFRPILEGVVGIDSAVLYGSVARQEATPNSDIDVALIVDERFTSEALTNALLEASPKPDHVMRVDMRNKVVAFFQSMRLKAEFSIHRSMDSFSRDLTGSAIPLELLPQAILIDRLGDVLGRLEGISGIGYRPNTVEDLVAKFIYEFDNASTFHRRSDGYRALYFYQIALHCLVQLLNMKIAQDRFQFLPRNLLVNIMDRTLRERLYRLNGSMFLPEMNGKKREMLDLLYETLDDLAFEGLADVRANCERIYERDRYWNLRAVNTYNPKVRWSNLLRSSAPALMNEDMLATLVADHDVHTVIDLRAPRELEEHPHPHGKWPIGRYVHAPLDPWSQPDWFKTAEYQQGSNEQAAYRFFALACRESISVVVRALAEVPNGKGALMHCHAGKDRTGIIVTLLHLVAGADHETVQTDYLASESDTYSCNLQIVLDIIEQEGGVEQYLLNCGLSQEEVNALKTRMSHL